jgi:alcohol dehydrogenase
MKALVYDGNLRLATDYPPARLIDGEAIIKPHLVGICNTDIEITNGYMGFRGVLGHEFVGTVVESGDRAWIGQRVVGEINAACLRCPTCLRGDYTHCPERTTLGIDRRDGVMAESFSLPLTCLHAVPDTVPDEAAVFAEPIAAALEIVDQQHVRPSEQVAIVGDGKLGLLIAQVLRLTGCDLTLIGKHPERWSSLERQGIRCFPHTQSLDKRFDLIVECTGNPGGLATARRLIRPRGRLVLKSTFAAASEDLNLSMIVVDEIQLLGSRCGPFAPALRLLERNLIDTAAMISVRSTLDQALEAFDQSRGNLKVLLEINSE